jgi:hypothetical protein
LEQHSDNPAPWLVFIPVRELEGQFSTQSASAPNDVQAFVAPVASLNEPEHNQHVSIGGTDPWSGGLNDTGTQIIRATRSWIQYGTVGFAVICIIIGAVKGLLGR